MYKLSKNDKLVIYLDRPLSTFNQNFFTRCFQPILSPLAYTFYLSLYSLTSPTSLESKEIRFTSLLKQLNIKNLDLILESRIELEALGLIKTYFQKGEDNLYIIVVNNLPTPYEFFKNELYVELLKTKIDNEVFEDLLKEYIVHFYDLSKFEDITEPIDEVFFKNSEYTNLWQQNDVKISFKNNHFDYEYVVLVLSSTTMINDEQLKSVDFYNNLNRLAWMFELNDDALITAVKNSVKDGIVDYNLLRTECKKQFKTETKLVRRTIEVESNSNIINMLNNLTPLQLVRNKYHTNLTSGEIEMFDKILVETNVSLGVLNVLIIYVLDTKDGEIPSYNYFLKVVNTWLRKGITTTEAALAEINKPKGQGKNKQKVSEWYNEYQNEIKDKETKTDQKNTEQSSIEDLEKFFNK